MGTRLIIAGCVVVAIIALGGYVYWTRKAIREANARVTAAEQSTELATATTGIVERVVRSEVSIRTQAERSVDVVQTAPGGDTPTDPAFRDRLCAAVSGMRDGSPACNNQPSPATP